MKEVICDGQIPSDRGMDECCSIAESIIEEIHAIAVPECVVAPSGRARSKGSFRKRLLRQIREARRLAMI
jgi:hypothetical protein